MSRAILCKSRPNYEHLGCGCELFVMVMLMVEPNFERRLALLAPSLPLAVGFALSLASDETHHTPVISLFLGTSKESWDASVSSGDRGNIKTTTAFSGDDREIHGLLGIVNLDREISAAFPTGCNERQLTSIHAVPPREHVKSLENDSIATTNVLVVICSPFTSVNACQSHAFSENGAR
jgi:hypothetical protein